MPASKRTAAERRELAALRRIDQNGALRKSQIVGPGKLRRRTFGQLQRASLVKCTTLGVPESFDNAYFDHSFSLTILGRRRLRELEAL